MLSSALRDAVEAHIARIEAGKLELEHAPFDVRRLLTEIAALEAPLTRAKGLNWKMDIANDVPRYVRGDAVRVQQIILNLLNNAIKFTQRGIVELRVSHNADRGIEFAVRDTGPGMSEGMQHRLFQRFEQESGPQRHSGSGLGLAICRELVACMSGEITVESVVGEGTTFRALLPLPLCDAPKIDHAEPASPVDTRRILLVEDDDTVAAVVVGLLNAQGHCVRQVGDGLAAISEIAVGHYDAALIDLDLPGIDGLTLARIIRSREREQGNAALILIAVTARSGGDEEARSIDAGMETFLRKPVSGAALAMCLRDAFAERFVDS